MSSVRVSGLPIDYLENAQKQGLAWVNGNSYHCEKNNECTPDFSCCMPKLFTRDRNKRLSEYNAWAAEKGFPTVA